MVNIGLEVSSLRCNNFRTYPVWCQNDPYNCDHRTVDPINGSLKMIEFEDENIKISARQAESDHMSNSVLLSFTGVGHALGGIDVQKPEFFGAGRSFDNIFFINDKTRSWSNNIDYNFLKKFLMPIVGNRKIFSIGNSMGGFNAIISSYFVKTEACIAFGPQFSVHPDIAPWETRWKNYISHIKEYRFLCVGDYITDATRYYIYTGGEGLDRRHASLFPVRSNIYHYSFPEIIHNAAPMLKERGLLDDLIQSCFNLSDGKPRDVECATLSPEAS